MKYLKKKVEDNVVDRVFIQRGRDAPLLLFALGPPCVEERGFAICAEAKVVKQRNTRVSQHALSWDSDGWMGGWCTKAFM